MSLRAPTVQRGQRLTARLWNDLAQAVNQGLAAPRDLDSGVGLDEVADTTLHEIARTTETVRVENPDDEDQYVDVQRILTVTTRHEGTG